MVKRSAVWSLFEEEPASKSAKCSKCGKNYKKPATETLRYHLLHAHCITVPKERAKAPGQGHGHLRPCDEENEDDPPAAGNNNRGDNGLNENQVQFIIPK
jgi:hypothetical protein